MSDKNEAKNTVTPESPSVFQTKYEEFAKELLETFPELASAIQASLTLTHTERLTRFQAEVRPSADSTQSIGALLPGVILPAATWATLSASNQKVIWEYVRLLSMCCFLEGFGSPDETHTKSWMEDIMGSWKDKLGSLDMEGLFKKFSGVFGSGMDTSGGSGFSMPKLPEKFLKGQLAKLAEEIVRDIKPEDLGFTPEMMAECEKSPSKSFDILLQVFTKNPAIIQSTIKKIGKRLQQKIQSGAIRPNEIAKEAEELMKEFAGNADMVGMMDSFKSAFGFEDMDIARAAGKEGSARLNIVKERLRKKMEEKKAATAAAPVSSTSAGGNTVVSPSEAEAIAAAFASNKKIDMKAKNQKQQTKK
jgi:hypothetical protein